MSVSLYKEKKFTKLLAESQAKRDQVFIGRKITTQVYGRFVEGTVIAVHPFGTVDVELNNGQCYRVSGLNLNKTGD